MLKVAIVGCGKIADDHAACVERIDEARLVAVCDREELMARQLCDRFAVSRTYRDLDEMLRRERPNVVHVTTPPASHASIAQKCMENGCHVYVEKPFTLNVVEAEELVAIAVGKGVQITVGHDDQFRHAARRMRALIKTGYLGGDPIHMESLYCYDLGYGSYSKALLGDRNHWIRRLPGQLLHNVISHGIARIAEFIQTDTPAVTARGFVSADLRARGERELIDELRVIVADSNGLTAYFTFSSQMRPQLHQFRVYGRKNGLILDQDNETLVRLRGARFTSYVEQFVPPLLFAREYLGNWVHNLGLFLRRDFHWKSGMKFLMEQFYHSILANLPPPIPYREIVLTARIMDAIFQQLNANAEEDKDSGASSLDPCIVGR